MKFEKINNDKIKVTISTDDLTANDIDFHSFMSNSDETHSLFLDVLEKAEKDYGFSTKDYSLRVETLALADGNFILTITRMVDSQINTHSENIAKKNPHVYRKTQKLDTTSAIYRFGSFDDFCNLVTSLHNNATLNIKNVSKDSCLYCLDNNYFLILVDINIKFKNLKGFFALITEFSTYTKYSDIFVAKLYETGTLIFKSKAFQNCVRYFIKN